MPQLLSLKSSEQPALVGVHLAHDQVDLLVEGLIGVVELVSTDRANTVVGMKRCSHCFILLVDRSSFNIFHAYDLGFKACLPYPRDQTPAHSIGVGHVAVNRQLFPVHAEKQGKQEHRDQNDIPGGQVVYHCPGQGN